MFIENPKKLVIAPKDYKIWGYYQCTTKESGPTYNLEPGYDSYGYLEKIKEFVFAATGVVIGEKDVVLQVEELPAVLTEVDAYLTVLMASRPVAYDKNQGYQRTILGETISINLRDINDKLISEVDNFHLLLTECIDQNKPLYFSIATAEDREKYFLPAGDVGK